MSNVFVAEMYKLKYNVTFYLCLITAIVISIAGSITNTSITMMTAFEGIAASLSIFLVIIISNLVCDDYEKKTMKNLISSGNNRFHIYGGKLLAAIVVGLIFFVVDGTVSMVSGYLLNGFGHGITALSIIESLLAQLLLIIVYVLTFFGFAAITKSSKYGTIIGIIYILFVAMVPWYLGNFIFHTNLEAFSIDTLTKSIENLNMSANMIINFIIYGGIAIALNLIGYIRLKKEED